MEKSQVFGLRCCELLASYDPRSQSLRMCQLSFEWAAPLSLEVLPRSGTIQNGKLYRLPSLERRICAEDGSVSLPTPMADDTQHTPNKPSLKSGKYHHLNAVLGQTKEAEQLGQKARLNPRFVRWMMGFPIGWLDLEP